MEAISAEAIEVEDLDPAGVLARIADAERRDREVQLEKLRLAYQWCVLHPATTEAGTATWGDAGLPGLSDCDASLGGDGTPAVAPFVAEELGAAMGVSTQSAMSLMARRPRPAAPVPAAVGKVEALEVAPYKTRRVADDTRSLPFEAARWVDEQLAARVDGFGLPTIERLVALAAARFAPEEQAEKEQAAASGRHVTLIHPRPGEFAGTSWLEAAGDTAGPDRLPRSWSATSPSSWAGSVTPTTTRPARPRPSASSPAASPPSRSPTRRRRRTLTRRPVQTQALRARLPGRPRHPRRRRPGRG